MTALADSAGDRTPLWIPRLSPAAYDRRVALSREERRALSLIAGRRCRWPAGAAEALSRLTAPINDVLAVAGLTPGSWAGPPTRWELLSAIGREGMAFWGWDHEQWDRTVAEAKVAVRQLVIAVAYQLCEITDLHWAIRGFKCSLFCRRVFGAEAVQETIGRAQAHLDTLGYAAQLRRPHLQRGLYELMLAARGPLLEDLGQRPGVLIELHAREPHNARRAGMEQLARTLVDMKVLPAPVFGAAATREDWLARSRASARDVPEPWLEAAQRWFVTSTLSRASRTQTYFALIKIGRWLAEEHPDQADPASWTRELAAGWVGRVDRMLVGEFSRAPNTDYMRRRSGGPLLPRTKAHLIWAPRRFFCDIQEWEWIERRFDPRRAFALPRSIRALIGPAPRVIADEVWAKLMWAGLNLTVEDLPLHGNRGGHGTPWYPLPLVRAITMLWLFAGLRTDEIMRLRVGAIRWQHQAEQGETERVCLLDVPTSKTATAFTKPVDPLVGDAIGGWEQVRPAHPPFTDPKTGELVELVFCFRGARPSPSYLNRVLVPLLCRKAGVPREDVRGAITGHRARATIATQLYNAKDPMSLFELQAWLGHSSPQSTQHYAQITPVTLTKAYTDAGYFARNVRAIEVLLDRGAVQTGDAASGNPFEYYDLGHGYCSYSFFEQCPHRMACARCDFYLPKQSSQAQLLEAKDGLQRMLVQIPLTDQERAAVDSDHDAVNRLLGRLTDTPTPAGPTPRDLDAADPTRVTLDVLHRNGSSDAAR